MVVFEKDAELGGTWHKNCYPGVACDVPSHFYSLSFAPNPNWSSHYSEGHEIKAYLQSVARQFDITNCFQFNSAVVSCVWRSDNCDWEIRVLNVITRETRVEYCKYVIASSSPLSEAIFPTNIKGVESFKGKIFHSSKWDRNFDLSNKSVAVVGTGASAIQIVPSIINKVKKLILFQRTPAWVVPRFDFSYPTVFKLIMKYVPFAQTMWRYALYLYSDVRYWGLIRRLPIISAFNEWILRKLIQREVNEPAVSQALLPNYSLGCKRLLVSDDYYRCFNKEAMTLVPSELVSVGENCVAGKDSVDRNVDVIIFCTGFDVLAGLGDLEIIGSSDVVFKNHTIDKNKLPGAYLGVYFHGLPNMFFTMGPNSGLGHSSVVSIIEAQLSHTIDMIGIAEQERYKWIEVKKDVVDEYNAVIQRDLSGKNVNKYVNKCNI